MWGDSWGIDFDMLVAPRMTRAIDTVVGVGFVIGSLLVSLRQKVSRR